MFRTLNDAVAMTLGLAVVGLNWSAALYLLPLAIAQRNLKKERTT